MSCRSGHGAIADTKAAAYNPVEKDPYCERRMRFVGLMLFGAALVVAPAARSAINPPPTLQTARFVYEPNNSGMLRAVRGGMEKGITFNGHFSQSYVACGLACGTYFFVDRWTGGVIKAPEDRVPRGGVAGC